MSSSDATSNVVVKSTPLEDPITSSNDIDQTSQAAEDPAQTEAQEPTTETLATNKGTTIGSTGGRKRKLTSDVWNHFNIVEYKGTLKAQCVYCETKLLGDPKQGTSHLHGHFKTCKLRTTRDIRQCLMKTAPTNTGETVVVGTYTFDQDNARKELAVMVCLHEYPLSIVDHIGFKRFCNALQPLFKVISRNTLKSDIFKLYNDEKMKTMNILQRNKSRIAITTDMWTTSNQNKGYMAVTAHYIDDSCKLHSRLVRFIYVPAPHTAEALSDVLVDCLMDWNLDRKLYGDVEACIVIGQVKRVVQDLVLEYATRGRERDQAARSDMPPPPPVSLGGSRVKKFRHESWQVEFAAHVNEESAFIDTE